MKREAFKMFLKPGFEKEYEKRHAAIWPELKKMLSDGGVYDYSIYWDKDTNILFACQKTKGEKIQLVGFGTFEVAERAERTGRNPQSGKEMTIPASKAPKFKAGKALKDIVNA